MTTVERARIVLDPKKLKLPLRPVIRSIDVEDYIDNSGEGALLLQVILDEATSDEDITGEAIVAIKSAIRESLLSTGVREFPYIVFAKRSELDDPGIVE